MEKRIKRIEIVVFITLLITVITLVSPYSNKLINSNTADEEIEETKELPSDLTKDYLNKTAYKIKGEYNHSDWAEFHNVFGDFAKAQISVDDIETGFIKLKSATGDIGTYAYSHYKYEGNRDNAEWFEFYYKCRFENGKGTIKISTRTVDEMSEITRVNIVLDEL